MLSEIIRILFKPVVIVPVFILGFAFYAMVSSQHEFTKIEVGMSRQQVLEIMGQNPDSVSTERLCTTITKRQACQQALDSGANDWMVWRLSRGITALVGLDSANRVIYRQVIRDRD